MSEGKQIEVDQNLIVAEKDFKGKTYIDIRKYFVEDGTNKLVPTRKGIFLYPNQVCDVISALAKFVNPKDLSPVINELEALESEGM